MSRTKQISKDLDQYILSRRRNENNTLTNKEEQLPIIKEKVTNADEFVNTSSEFDEEKNKTTLDRKSWFSALMEKMFGPDEDTLETTDIKETETHSVSMNVLQEDMRYLAELSIGIIKRLPRRTLEDFKSSEDFSKFKGILRKHSIIK